MRDLLSLGFQKSSLIRRAAQCRIMLNWGNTVSWKTKKSIFLLMLDNNLHFRCLQLSGCRIVCCLATNMNNQSVCGSAICSTKEQQFSQHSQLFYFAFPLVNFRFYCIFFGCGKCWCTLHSCCNNSWQWQVAYENVCSRVCKCLFDKLLKFHCLR